MLNQLTPPRDAQWIQTSVTPDQQPTPSFRQTTRNRPLECWTVHLDFFGGNRARRVLRLTPKSSAARFMFPSVRWSAC